MCLRPTRATVALALACLTTGCGTLTGPAAPPLDIRGTYNVVWFLGYNDPEGNPAVPDPSLPRGECSGTVTIQHQSSNSFSGTIRIPEGVNPPCHPANFPLAGRMTRAYASGENHYDYGWDLFMASDVEALLGCAFTARPPGKCQRWLKVAQLRRVKSAHPAGGSSPRSRPPPGGGRPV